jgi:hypothetical protein
VLTIVHTLSLSVNIFLDGNSIPFLKPAYFLSRNQPNSGATISHPKGLRTGGSALETDFTFGTSLAVSLPCLTGPKREEEAGHELERR